jgi:hypothetical protein
MGSIQQIYQSGVYGGKSRKTLGDVYRTVYQDKSSLTQRMYPYRLSKHSRAAWIVSCKSWLGNGQYIPLFVNPSDVQWSIPRRGTVQKTAAGAVRNTWRNRFRRTYFDEFTLNITFQSGNIMPSMAYVDRDMTNYQDLQDAYNFPHAPPGLGNFYMFLELLDVGKLAGAYENYHIIIMHTRVFPVLRLEGWFTEEPVTFAESAQNANQINWTATFQVYRTYPRIQSATLMTQTYREFVQSVAFREAVPMGRLNALNQAGDIFAGGLGDGAPGGIPTGTRGSNEGSGAFDNLTVKGYNTKGGSTQKGASTLQTSGSAARSEKSTTSGETLSPQAFDFFFGR